jgi:hypothetical protein
MANTSVPSSSNLPAAHTHLSLLLPLSQISDPDLSHQISLLEIDLLMHPSGPDLPKAYLKISALLAEKLDLAHTLHLLTLKAAVFAAAGKPEKGFSIAVRAASRAERAGLLPGMFLLRFLQHLFTLFCAGRLWAILLTNRSSRLSKAAPQASQPDSSSSSHPALLGWQTPPLLRAKPSGTSS